MPLLGSLIPFAKTAADRGGDPRKSLEERYRGKSDYLGRVTEAGARAREAGYVLREDLPFLLERAAAGWDWVPNGRPATSTQRLAAISRTMIPRHVAHRRIHRSRVSWASPWPAIF